MIPTPSPTLKARLCESVGGRQWAELPYFEAHPAPMCSHSTSLGVSAVVGGNLGNYRCDMWGFLMIGTTRRSKVLGVVLPLRAVKLQHAVI